MALSDGVERQAAMLADRFSGGCRRWARRRRYASFHEVLKIALANKANAARPSFSATCNRSLAQFRALAAS